MKATMVVFMISHTNLWRSHSQSDTKTPDLPKKCTFFSFTWWGEFTKRHCILAQNPTFYSHTVPPEFQPIEQNVHYLQAQFHWLCGILICGLPWLRSINLTFLQCMFLITLCCHPIALITLMSHRTQRYIACKAIIDLIVWVKRHLAPCAMLC